MIILNFNVDGIFVLPWNENVLKLFKVFTTLEVRSYWQKSDSDIDSKWFHRKSRSHKSATKIEKNRFLAVQMNLQSTFCSLSLSKNCVGIKLLFTSCASECLLSVSSSAALQTQTGIKLSTLPLLPFAVNHVNSFFSQNEHRWNFLAKFLAVFWKKEYNDVTLV